MNYYVFRINYEDYYKSIRNELLNGKLRQGWGVDGMNLLSVSYEDYERAWHKKWGTDDASPNYIRRKYNNLRNMLEMKPGDRIIVPKLSIDKEDGWTSFTILECTGTYYFEILSQDFGHVIPVKVIASFSYGRDGDAMIVSQKFNAYRSAVNHVYAEEFHAAIERLIEKAEKNPNYTEEEDKGILHSLCSQTSSARYKYLNNILDNITRWTGHRFEQIIEKLFNKNGYELISRNNYDGKGADVDLLFDAFVPSSFMGDLYSLSGADMPQIRVQAKNKIGTDQNDLNGVLQLVNMEGMEGAINILINTTLEFSDKAKETAVENGIILINGIDFASLLVKYGLDVFE